MVCEESAEVARGIRGASVGGTLREKCGVRSAECGIEGLSEARDIQNHKAGVEPLVVLLPGSRSGELKRHLPVMLGALKTLQDALPKLRARMVLPTESLVAQAKSRFASVESGSSQCGGPARSAEPQADLAIASTGTVTMECAYFGVPTVTLYKRLGLSLGISLGIITAKWFTMPNLLANEGNLS